MKSASPEFVDLSEDDDKQPSTVSTSKWRVYNQVPGPSRTLKGSCMSTSQWTVINLDDDNDSSTEDDGQKPGPSKHINDNRPGLSKRGVEIIKTETPRFFTMTHDKELNKERPSGPIPSSSRPQKQKNNFGQQNPSLSRPQQNNNFGQRPSAYQRARSAFQQNKEEAELKKQEAIKKQQEIVAKRNEGIQRRKDNFKAYSKKNKHGQPVMAGRIGKLLEKIQAQANQQLSSSK